MLTKVKLGFGTAILLLLTACGGGSSDDENQTSTEVPPYPQVDTSVLLQQTENELAGLAIDDFFQQAFLLISGRNDENAIATGLANELSVEQANLGNISDDYLRQTYAMEAKILELLRAYDRESLTPQQQLSFDIYQQHLLYQQQAEPYVLYNFPATVGLFGWQGSTESLFSEVFILQTEHDINLYIHLLRQVGRRFDQIIEQLKQREAIGIIEPAITLTSARDAVASFANQSVTQTSYYRTLSDKLSSISSLTSSQRASLQSDLNDIVENVVLPAYDRLEREMTRLLAKAPSSIGFGQYTNGAAYYQQRLNYYTSSNQTADDIHQLGLAELARIHTEMRSLFTQLGYASDLSIPQAYSRVNQDAGTIAANQVKDTYEALIAEAYARLPESFSTLPQQEVVVIGGNTGGYYIAGSDDGSRPGAFYADTSRSLPYTTMPTLAYHEAVPGHHMQIALANEMELPLFQRKSRFTSYIEGWGLYAERLAFDLGWYQDDPYGDLGRLQFEAMRAARLVIDTGIHVKGWSFSQANQFHIDNVGFNGSIARYSVWPGQATAYSTGMLKLLELKEHSQQVLGDNFNLKQFHDWVLGSGAMPLNILEQRIQQNINELLSQTD